MPRIEFTSHLTRHVPCSAMDVEADSLHRALEIVFERVPALRGYVLDDQHCIRQHVAIFVDNQLIRQRNNWNIPLTPSSQVYVMQALSGG